MKKILRHIISIEARVYPPVYRQMQDIRSMKDLKEYCESKPHIISWCDGYCLFTKREVVDLCSITPIDFGIMHKISKRLRKFYKYREFAADLRQNTSYKLVKIMERRGVLEVVSDEAYDWGGETFHEVKIKFRR